MIRGHVLNASLVVFSVFSPPPPHFFSLFFSSPSSPLGTYFGAVCNTLHFLSEEQNLKNESQIFKSHLKSLKLNLES
jgi:hypothetical protein